jgi:glycosyltransferase involved in cell wall biosynthesis
MEPKVTSRKGNGQDIRISVCIIAKNEEASIENCLKSVQDIAHEIIVVDTGSTDKTKKIASRYARVYDFKWQDDFSKARNESVKHATGDWILVIDADEELTEKSREYIFPFLKSQPYKNEPVAFSLKILEPRNIIFKTVLFRAGCGIHFVKPLHEHPFRENDSLIIAKADFLTIIHSAFKNSTKEELINKNKKYIFKLNKIIRDSYKFSDKSYFSYHLGNAYAANEQFNSALRAYQEAYKHFNQSKRDKKSQIYGNIILALIRIHTFTRKRYKEAMVLIDELLAISPDFPDALFFQAYCHEYQGNYAKAIEIYEKIITLLKQYHSDNLDPLGINSLQDFLYLNIMIELGRCYIITGNMEKALFCLNKAYEKKQDIPELLTLLTLYYFLENDLSKVYYFFRHNKINLTEQEKEYLFYVSKLPFEDIRYKNALVTFLKMLEEAKTDWFREELKLIGNKIRELAVPRLSVCIITENQEKYIERCLNSVLPVADLITLIDTGSTDRTKEIAAKYARVLEIKSKGDGGGLSRDIKIRNQMLESSDSDWVLFLKGNEELLPETRGNLLRFLNEMPYQDKPVALCLECIDPDSQEGYLKANLVKTGFNTRYSDNDQVYSPDQKLLLVTTAFKLFYRNN